jgi:thiosulfate dehydrogenase [quinone] large subunit
MTQSQKISLFLLRISLGALFLYAGITKLMDPNWSAQSYLVSAKTFSGLFQWFVQPQILPFIDFINEWGLTLLGVSLILGIGVRLSSILGAMLMALYYFPILEFPMAGTHSYIVDDHVIYALILIYFASIRAGRVWGLEEWCSSLPICSRYPALRKLLG